MNTLPSFLEKNHPIGQYSGYKTSVTARGFFSLEREEDLPLLAQIYQYAQGQSLPFLMIGGGTNILFAHDRFDGIVIKNNLAGFHYDPLTKKLQSASGVPISDIASLLEREYQQPLWQRFIGLPGSIGGALVGNAGCFGIEAASYFLRARIYGLDSGEMQEFSQREMQFSYRHSFLKQHSQFFLVSAVFDLSVLREKYSSEVDVTDFRKNQQPTGKSCGSFFKNPSREQQAGKLIEQVGLRGYHHNGAYWSQKHANFLMAEEGCRPQDLIELVLLTQQKVKEATGVTLVNEVNIIS